MPMLEVNIEQCLLLQNVQFSVVPGEHVAIVGPSGSGKSTLLKAIAGFNRYQGEILLNGQRLEITPVHQRPIAYLSQELYLFSHLSVYWNLHCALWFGWGGADRRQTVLAQLRSCHADHLIKRRIAQLSGGERQRVALARALIRKPSLLLLDEPFTGLDWPTRKALWDELKQQCREMTLLLVTHDPEEAASLSDRQLRLGSGKLLMDSAITIPASSVEFRQPAAE